MLALFKDSCRHSLWAAGSRHRGCQTIWELSASLCRWHVWCWGDHPPDDRLLGSGGLYQFRICFLNFNLFLCPSRLNLRYHLGAYGTTRKTTSITRHFIMQSSCGCRIPQIPGSRSCLGGGTCKYHTVYTHTLTILQPNLWQRRREEIRCKQGQPRTRRMGKICPKEGSA